MSSFSLTELTHASSKTSSVFYGWDMLYDTIENAVTNNDDVLVALVHFVMAGNCNFRCIGVGDAKTAVVKETGSRMLPSGWNKEQGQYALLYKLNDCVYQLYAHKVDECLVVDLLNTKTEKGSSISLKTDELVARRHGEIFDMIPKADDEVKRMREELINPHLPDIAKKTEEEQAEEDLEEHLYGAGLDAMRHGRVLPIPSAPNLRPCFDLYGSSDGTLPDNFVNPPKTDF